MKLTLKAKKREVLGRKSAELRKQGFVPAELYGKGVKNEHLSVDAKEFEAIYSEAGESTMIDLDLEGKKLPVLIHNVSRHFLNEGANCIDFYQPRLDEVVRVDVPIKFVGESPIVKEGKGIFVVSMEDLEIEALPTALPQEFEIDISSLTEIDAHLSVKDLKIPEGVKVLVDENTAIASVKEKMSEEEDIAMSEEVDLSAIEAEKEKEDGAEEADADSGEEKKAEESKEE